jgi:hypothetical protein
VSGMSCEYKSQDQDTPSPLEQGLTPLSNQSPSFVFYGSNGKLGSGGSIINNDQCLGSFNFGS